MIPYETPLRILAVDDEPTISALIKRVLSPITTDQLLSSDFSYPDFKHQSGEAKAAPPQLFDLTICQQGDEAIEAVKKSKAEKNPFAVAFMDVMMPPGPDGIVTAERIRAIDPYVEIVMVTAYSDVDPKDIAKRVHPAHKLLYIQKPFHPLEIYQFAIALGSKWIMENQLRQSHKQLEKRVEERTAELRETNERLRQEITERIQVGEALIAREEELKKTNDDLEETNSTLRVLLKKFQEKKKEIEERILTNVKESVQPLMDKLKNSRLTTDQRDQFLFLETSLNEIVSPFIHNLNSRYSGLTPTEIQVANLIKEGKTTKEIADFLNSSARAVEFHRNSLRSKLGLKMKKTNLRSFLLSLCLC